MRAILPWKNRVSPPPMLAGSLQLVVMSLSNETRVPRWLFRVDRGLYDPVMWGLEQTIRDPH